MRNWASDYKNKVSFYDGLLGEDAPNYKVAMKRASQLAREGYDLFRGQVTPRPLEPSIRRNSIDQRRALRDLSEFAAWVHTRSELAALHGDMDAILAVAQHYGLPTALLDFSTDPRVAGFFSCPSSKEEAALAYRPSCIACIKSSSLRESWAALNGIARIEDRDPDFRLVKVPARGFKRIAAQSGVFLWTSFQSDALESWTDIWRVYFPPTRLRSSRPFARLFPTRLSHEERLVCEFIASLRNRGH